MKTCEECSNPVREPNGHLCHRHFELAKRDLFRDEKPEVLPDEMQTVQETA